MTEAPVMYVKHVQTCFNDCFKLIPHFSQGSFSCSCAESIVVHFCSLDLSRCTQCVSINCVISLPLQTPALETLVRDKRVSVPSRKFQESKGESFKSVKNQVGECITFIYRDKKTS